MKMIDSCFLATKMQLCIYIRKEGTKGSYYSGNKILPNRLSYERFDFTKVSNKGRCVIEEKAGQLMGNFKKSEESPLKQFHPYSCRTQIFKCADYPLMIGYGTLGISEADGKVHRDNGDVVVLYSSDNLDTLYIFYFQGLNKPEFKSDMLEYVNDYVRKKMISLLSTKNRKRLFELIEL